MKKRSTNRKRRTEAGIALLISIFVLLLISVVAIALVVSSGTESALAGNYRSSTGVYYAALSGLEEARGRLLAKNPDAFKTTDPSTFLPGTDLIMGKTYYLINPVGTEVITPWDSTSTYPDSQFQAEFGPSGFAAPTNPSPTALSVWNRTPLQSLNLPGPLYKWVRINAVSEKSLGVDADSDGLTNATTPLFYDGAHLRFSNSSSAGPQVLELTAFATLPNGSQKLVQYLVAPVPITLPPFPSALTLAGSVVSSVVSYTAPSTNGNFFVKGIDQDCSGALTANPSVPAIGDFDSSDTPAITNGIPGTFRSTNYPGTTGSPDIAVIYGSFSASMQTPAGLDAVMQTIIQNADATVPTTSPSAETTFLTNLVSSGAMSSTNPLTVVVNGDLDLTGWHNTGYGLLLVTGILTYDPDASWRGIVIVVGQGTVVGSRAGSGEIDGAVLVARTRDPSGNLLSGSYLGSINVDFNHSGSSMGGNGIRYSSCWIQKSQPTAGYKILSFHEISQQ